MDRCETCGLDLDSVELAAIRPRVEEGVDAIVDLLSAARDRAGARPAQGRWSSLEYAAHVRDVLLTLRDRTVIGLVENDPTFKPLYRDERVDLGLYRADTVDAVVPELRAAAAMYFRLFATLDADQLDRIVQYGYPGPTTRTLQWMGRQAVHEVEHHLADVRENAETLARQRPGAGGDDSSVLDRK